MDPCVQAFLDKFSEDTEDLVRNLAEFSQLAADKQTSSWDYPPDPSRCEQGARNNNRNSGYGQLQTQYQNDNYYNDSKESCCNQSSNRPQNNYSQPQQFKSSGGCCGGNNTNNYSSQRPNSAQPFQSQPNPCSIRPPANLNGVSLEHYMKYHSPDKGCGASGPCHFCNSTSSDCKNSGPHHHQCPGELSAAGGFKSTDEHIRSFAQRFSETERTLMTLRNKLEDLNYVMKRTPLRHNPCSAPPRQSPMPMRGNCQRPECEYSDSRMGQNGNQGLIGLPRVNLPYIPPITRSRYPSARKEYDMSTFEIPIEKAQRVPVIPGTFVSEMNCWTKPGQPRPPRVSFCD